jgi:hypothetical protein
MWIKKTPKELTSETRARRLGAGVITLFVAFLLFVFGLPHARFHFSIAARIAAVLVAGAMLLAWYMRAQLRRLHSAVWVCERCNVVKASKDEATCSCGGTLTPLSEMNWLEAPPFQKLPPLPAEAEHARRAAHSV